MDDSCVVCAETLEWVAYGACGHRDVCSTCVTRLRFICSDRRCCICKTESNVVFVTKALGDYTRTINDFSLLPSEQREGRVGPYWYHEDTQAFFDDLDQYKMIKAMCRLSCSVCDRMDEKSNNGSKRIGKFRNIEQLKGHLFHQHRLIMCRLCLGGRKVFICEQKLYTRSQLSQHITSGDSEVDGSECERGGFMGHPMCEFCRSPFYGDNELYSHMSTEHYTCHICQRQHPGQYEYYRNYNDLEVHFNRDHFLCDDEACLAKKFVVFPSEAELKRHNAMEHGGQLSRAQRNAALQIPTSFRYRRSNEQDSRHGRGRAFRRDFTDDELSFVIQVSLEADNLEARAAGPSSSSSSAQVGSDHLDTDNVDPLVKPFESLDVTDPTPASRYLQALSHTSKKPLEESSFPPLPVASSSSKQKSKQDSDGLPVNTMAAHLRQQKGKNVKLLNPGPAFPGLSHGPAPSTKVASDSATGSGSSTSSPSPAWPSLVHGPPLVGSSSSSNSIRMIHSVSEPNLNVVSTSYSSSTSDFPPVSSTQKHKLPTDVEDVHSANKLLVKKIRAALGFDEDKYSAFKEISGQYRRGLMETAEYFGCVRQFGLSDLVCELARLCPDVRKQRELVDIYNANGAQEGSGWGNANVRMKQSSTSKKGKRVVGTKGANLERALANSVMNTVRELQANYKPSDVVEVLSKDDYRSANGKSKVVDEEKTVGEHNSLLVPRAASGQNIGHGVGGSKQQKRSSKFHRTRLGSDSSEAVLRLDKTVAPLAEEGEGNRGDSGGLPVRGVWRNRGGQRLLGTGAKK